MAQVASYLTVNISSPNTPGLRDLQAPAALDDLLKRVQAARQALPHKPPLLVKLAPDLADADLPEVVGIILAQGVDGIIVSNTTLLPRGRGGRSPSPARAEASRPSAVARSTRMLAGSTSSRKASCR